MLYVAFLSDASDSRRIGEMEDIKAVRLTVQKRTTGFLRSFAPEGWI